jgi:hypothetical protein
MSLTVRLILVSTVHVTLLSYQCLSKKLGVSLNGTKRKSFDQMCNSGHMEKVDNDPFDHRHQIVKGEKVPIWIIIILNPEAAAAVPGVDMATARSLDFGFYGSTNKESAVGGERHNLPPQGRRIESST